MITEESLNLAERILQPWAHLTSHPASDRLDITIENKSLKAAVHALVETRWGHLVAITGMDHPGVQSTAPNERQWERLAEEAETGTSTRAQAEGAVEVLYTFSRGAALLNLRLSVRYSFPVLQTICNLVPAATLYERELIEMYGVKIVGTPSTEHLLLPDDWPDGIYPMRKSFTGLK
jgi:NADH:ubiquinone oxidoreductase subunit C